MSVALLESLANDLANRGLLNGYAIKYYRWKDKDLSGSAKFVLFRMAGSSGPRDSVVQSPDVKILFVGEPDDIRNVNDIADGVFNYFAGIEKPEFVQKLEPLASVLGPYELDNSRCVFEVNVRCFIEGYA